MKNVKVFISSSSDLRMDRDRVEIYLNRKNEQLYKRGIFVEINSWENMENLSQTRIQDEYNRLISESDILIMLFFNKVGKYIEEEFTIAFGSYRERKKPFILTFFKDAPVNVGQINRSDMQGLWEFQDKLRDLGYFYMNYQNLDELEVQLNKGIESLIKSDFETLDANSEKSEDDKEKVLINSVIGNANKVMQNITSGKDSNINF